MIGRCGFDLAVVLSACTNPYRDNGFKFSPATATSSLERTERASKQEARGPREVRAPAGPAGSRRVRDSEGSERGLPARSTPPISGSSSIKGWTCAGLRQRATTAWLEFQKVGRDVSAWSADARKRNTRGVRLDHTSAGAARVAGGHVSDSPSTATGPGAGVDRRGAGSRGRADGAVTLHYAEQGRMNRGRRRRDVSPIRLHAAMERPVESGERERRRPACAPRCARGMDARQESSGPHLRWLQRARRTGSRARCDARGARAWRGPERECGHGQAAAAVVT